MELSIYIINHESKLLSVFHFMAASWCTFGKFYSLTSYLTLLRTVSTHLIPHAPPYRLHTPYTSLSSPPPPHTSYLTLLPTVPTHLIPCSPHHRPHTHHNTSLLTYSNLSCTSL